MRQFFRYFMLILLISSSCSTFEGKIKPEYVGVAPEFASIVMEYKDLAGQHRIQFKQEVTVGFKKLKDDKSNIIGLCTYGSGFREIDIDPTWWGSGTLSNKKSLLFHELTHCYCTRDHDYGAGLFYPKTTVNKVLASLPEKYIFILRQSSPGYLDDGCSSSLMSPYVVSAYCYDRHTKHYTDEMFERCIPY